MLRKKLLTPMHTNRRREKKDKKKYLAGILFLYVCIGVKTGFFISNVNRVRFFNDFATAVV
jgi:hypothetical protein